MIGNETTLTVLEVKGSRVRIGINAPKEVPIHREEIFNRIQDDIGHTNETVHSAVREIDHDSVST